MRAFPARPRTRNFTLGLILTAVMTGLVLLLALLGPVPAADAASNQVSAMQDDGRLENADPGIRNTALDEMQALGVDVVKLGAFWRRYAPNPGSESKPRVDLTDPASYDWAQLEPAGRGHRRRGMTPWIMISSPGPRLGDQEVDRVGRARRRLSARRQGLRRVRRGASAAGSRKCRSSRSGTNRTSSSGCGRRSVRASSRTSGVHYRKTYIAAQKALVKSGHANDTILFGGLAPRAFLPKVGQRATQPLRFLRDFFCLDEKLKPSEGTRCEAALVYRPVLEDHRLGIRLPPLHHGGRSGGATDRRRRCADRLPQADLPRARPRRGAQASLEAQDSALER